MTTVTEAIAEALVGLGITRATDQARTLGLGRERWSRVRRGEAVRSSTVERWLATAEDGGIRLVISITAAGATCTASRTQPDGEAKP